METAQKIKPYFSRKAVRGNKPRVVWLSPVDTDLTTNNSLNAHGFTPKTTHLDLHHRSDTGGTEKAQRQRSPGRVHRNVAARLLPTESGATRPACSTRRGRGLPRTLVAAALVVVVRVEARAAAHAARRRCRRVGGTHVRAALAEVVVGVVPYGTLYVENA